MIYDSYKVPIIDHNSNLVIGGVSDINDKFVDEISVWNKSLTFAQVKKLLFQKLAGDEIGLLFYYPIDEKDNDVNIKDRTRFKWTSHSEGIIEYLVLPGRTLNCNNQII